MRVPGRDFGDASRKVETCNRPFDTGSFHRSSLGPSEYVFQLEIYLLRVIAPLDGKSDDGSTALPGRRGTRWAKVGGCRRVRFGRLL